MRPGGDESLSARVQPGIRLDYRTKPGPRPDQQRIAAQVDRLHHERAVAADLDGVARLGAAHGLLEGRMRLLGAAAARQDDERLRGGDRWGNRAGRQFPDLDLAEVCVPLLGPQSDTPFAARTATATPPLLAVVEDGNAPALADHAQLVPRRRYRAFRLLSHFDLADLADAVGLHVRGTPGGQPDVRTVSRICAALNVGDVQGYPRPGFRAGIPRPTHPALHAQFVV